MNAFKFAGKIISTLALDPLLPAYSAITFALAEKSQGLLCASGNNLGQLVVANGLTGPAGGTLNLSGDVAQQTQIISASGAGVITIKSGTVLITATGAATPTLAAPTAGVDDGKRLTIESTTAQAHTVTNSTPGFNNGSTASDVATFTTAIGNGFEVVAYNGVWWTIGTAKGVTLG